jgi:HK97 family phage portal protein
MTNNMRPFKSLINSIPVPYVSSGAARGNYSGSMFGETPVDRKKLLDTMGMASTLYAVVSTNATSVGGVEWELFRKSASGKREDRKKVTNHSALTVWNKPNNFFTRQQFVETEQQHLDLTGEGWWVLYTDPRAPSVGPTEIWPVRPDRIFPVRHPTQFLLGYIYRSPDGQEIPLDTKDVIPMKTINPIDPYRGMGPVQTLLSNIYGYRAAIDYNRNFFANGAEPGGILSFPEELEEDQWNRMKRRWNSNHQGVSNVGKVAILEGGAQWIDRKYTNKDMEYVELINLNRDLIREAFGIHKSILGQSDDVNYANALAAEDSYAVRQVIPRLERFKSALNTYFLPLFPNSANLEFDYCNPRPKNSDEENKERESKVNAYKTLVDSGVIPEDAASVVGLPEMATKTIPSTQEGPVNGP